MEPLNLPYLNCYFDMSNGSDLVCNYDCLEPARYRRYSGLVQPCSCLFSLTDSDQRLRALLSPAVSKHSLCSYALSLLLLGSSRAGWLFYHALGLFPCSTSEAEVAGKQVGSRAC